MDLQPNKGKNLLITVDHKKFARYPIKTKVITPEDKDVTLIIEESVKPYLKPKDIVFISEKAVAITQGRSYPLESVKVSWLAKTLSDYVMKTPVGIGLGSPQTMQLAIDEVGIPRILLAAVIGALGKLLGVRGWFYIVAGDKARSIDGAVPYALPPYNTYVSKGPEKAKLVAENIAKKIQAGVAIVDANDLGVNILGASVGVDKKLLARAIKDNPLGQGDEQTPIGILREVEPTIPENVVIKQATLTDKKSITEITNLLALQIPNFVWNSDKFIEQQINQGQYFLVHTQGDMAGIMSLRKGNDKMHIETLVVKKEFQGKGLGSAFIAFAKNITKEKGFKLLHAYSFYEYNIEPFYLKSGFKKLNHIGYYHGRPYHCFELTC